MDLKKKKKQKNLLLGLIILGVKVYFRKYDSNLYETFDRYFYWHIIKAFFVVFYEWIVCLTIFIIFLTSSNYVIVLVGKESKQKWKEMFQGSFAMCLNMHLSSV